LAETLDVATIDLAELPRPERDPTVAALVQEIAALEIEATALVAEVKSTSAARVGAEEQTVAAIALGDANGAREAEALATQFTATLLEARGHLRSIGARLGELEAERHAALAAACRNCAAAWKDAEQVLGLSLSEVEARATEIKANLAEVVSVRRQFDQVTGPGEPIAVKFVRPPRPYGAGEIATFAAGEAARLVILGQAQYVDVWRRLAAGGTE
jgi:hypothetical protein